MPQNREFNWTNIAFLVLSPIAAFIGVGVYIYHQGFHLGDLSAFWAMYVLTGMGICAGYHRYYSHRTYDCHPILQVLYLVFGAAAMENSCLHWSSDHRNHHRFVDREEDPYNIMKGIFWAHMGWIFYKDNTNRSFDNVKDLQDDPLVMWQHKYYLPLAAVIGFGVPFLMGLAYGHPWGGVLWGGLLRVVLVHHGTFLINSAAHFFGSQPYSVKDSSRDNWWLAFFTFGEGYHNYHHAFQGDYRNGIAWYQWDPTKWWIRGFNFVGLTWRLNTTSEWTVMKAKLEMEYLKVKPILEAVPDTWRERAQVQLEACQKRMELAMVQLTQLRQRSREWAHEARNKARRERRQLQAAWLRQMQDCRESAGQAREEYMRLLREIRRIYVPAL